MSPTSCAERWLKLGTCMDAVEHDVLTYTTLPEQYRVKPAAPTRSSG